MGITTFVNLSASGAASEWTPARNIEIDRRYNFHDHVRIEQLLFDGVLSPVGGALEPDLGRPGNGLEFKRDDAQRYAV